MIRHSITKSFPAVIRTVRNHETVITKFLTAKIWSGTVIAPGIGVWFEDSGSETRGGDGKLLELNVLCVLCCHLSCSGESEKSQEVCSYEENVIVEGLQNVYTKRIDWWNLNWCAFVLCEFLQKSQPKEKWRTEEERGREACSLHVSVAGLVLRECVQRNYKVFSPQVSSALFFAYNSQLGPPFHIIVDTNFINFSIQNKLDIVQGMMDCLYAKCKYPDTCIQLCNHTKLKFSNN